MLLGGRDKSFLVQERIHQSDGRWISNAWVSGFRGFSQPIPNGVWHQSTLPAGKISNCEGLCTRQAFFCRCVPDQATEFMALAERLWEQGLKHGGIGKFRCAVPREFFEVGRQGSGRNRIAGRCGSKCL